MVETNKKATKKRIKINKKRFGISITAFVVFILVIVLMLMMGKGSKEQKNQVLFKRTDGMTDFGMMGNNLFYTYSGKLYCVSSNGEQKYDIAIDKNVKQIVYGLSKIYILNADRTILQIDAKTGSILNRIDVKDANEIQVKGDQLIVLGDSAFYVYNDMKLSSTKETKGMPKKYAKNGEYSAWIEIGEQEHVESEGNVGVDPEFESTLVTGEHNKFTIEKNNKKLFGFATSSQDFNDIIPIGEDGFLLIGDKDIYFFVDGKLKFSKKVIYFKDIEISKDQIAVLDGNDLIVMNMDGNITNIYSMQHDAKNVLFNGKEILLFGYDVIIKKEDEELIATKSKDIYKIIKNEDGSILLIYSDHVERFSLAE